ncbi:cold shock domain-containing protein [uncultured Chitinophaga sp.]|jgi:cold shock protein|uniref:cold-shock protein n=1 Tax=uncultured Chitinophaga sp. TaxID=339340 RepID=UPI0025D5CEB2|nr:cold shock domain-containing protein [uncultured Chitinophaga sp.]
MNTKFIGTVKFFNETKGFGFIKHEETNKETFVHVTGLVHEIQADDRVEFELQEGRKGENAVNVRRID